MKISWMVLMLQSRQNLTIWNKQMGRIMSKHKVGLWFFFFAHHLILPYICTCTNIHEEILNGFKLMYVIKQTRNIAWNKQKGINYVRAESGIMVLFSLHIV